jgi:pyruvate dehydrogenase E2 component (dihydrolipoamide acetyltransferase)
LTDKSKSESKLKDQEPILPDLKETKDFTDFSGSYKGPGPYERISGGATNRTFKSKNPSSGPAAFIDLPISNMRRTIAKRLTESKQQLPHYYLSMDISLNVIDGVRKKMNLSINDFILKSSGYAMTKCPTVNSVWKDDKIRQYSNVDISMAVATSDGLITPIVTDVNNKPLESIHEELDILYEKAKNNKLQPQDYQGGTFTVSSLGTFGIKHFTAIINSPQSAILAVGRGEKKVLVTESGTFEISKVMTVTLSCDHRVIDGAVGAKWLNHFKEAMENPILLYSF